MPSNIKAGGQTPKERQLLSSQNFFFFSAFCEAALGLQTKPAARDLSPAELLLPITRTRSLQ